MSEDQGREGGQAGHRARDFTLLAAVITAIATIVGALIQGGLPAYLKPGPQEGAPTEAAGPEAPPDEGAARAASIDTAGREGQSQSEMSGTRSTGGREADAKGAAEIWAPAIARAEIVLYSSPAFGARTARTLSAGQRFRMETASVGPVWVKVRVGSDDFYVLKSSDYQRTD